MKLKLTFVIGLLDSFSAVFLSSIYLKKLIDYEKLGIYLKIFWKDLANINTLNNFLTQQLNSLLAYVFILATIYLPFLKPLKLDIFYAYKLCNYMQLPANYIQIGRFRDDLVPPFLIKTFSKLILVCSIFT